MNRRLFRCLPGTLVMSVAISSAHAQPAPSPPSSATPSAGAASEDPARKLFEEGSAALSAGKFAEAVEKLRAAWQQKKSYDVAGNLGAALLQLGEHAEAARFLWYAVESYPAGGKPSVKKLTEEYLTEAKAKVTEVRLQVTGDAPAPAISVDGAAIDPAFGTTTTFVAPGKRVIEASAKGYQTARQTIDATEGGTADVTLALVPIAQPAERSMLWPAIAFGAGGAGLVMGAIAAGVAAAKTSDLKKVCGEALACPPSERGALDGATTAAHVSTVGFVLAGVGAAVGVTLLLVPMGQERKAQAGVIVGPAFVGVKGAF